MSIIDYLKSVVKKPKHVPTPTPDSMPDLTDLIDQLAVEYKQRKSAMLTKLRDAMSKGTPTTFTGEELKSFMHNCSREARYRVNDAGYRAATVRGRYVQVAPADEVHTAFVLYCRLFGLMAKCHIAPEDILADENFMKSTRGPDLVNFTGKDINTFEYLHFIRVAENKPEYRVMHDTFKIFDNRPESDMVMEIKFTWGGKDEHGLMGGRSAILRDCICYANAENFINGREYRVYKSRTYSVSQ